MAIEFNIKQSTKLQGVYIITPNISSDLRGNIYTSFLKDEIDKLLPKGLFFKHDKFSLSRQNVLRGIHGDTKSYKFVSCVYGEILQVVVDCRKESPSYLQYEKFIINQNEQKFILIPPHMGNAYYVKSKEALYHYKLAYEGEYFDAPDQFSLAYDDNRIGIDWDLNNQKPILSNRDLQSLNSAKKENK
ncbi:dTDP-4-dehydrorhamnose 3,5-epimerase [Campylobacter sp. MIT 12-8780]|uniref:dTDP-4-dehydrorhamnose 3,5-epimerase n=1 Tax=unclassified Campylobacter TaxID=2593542 RepID=UPI0010F52D95|nr:MULTISPECIES: dTDP-4-dehydrorhamnose 3,5-epimerase family protein [unclassified Campylobacter]NDJ26759.1 dTDP-4-keto-6-deoxy-D-glucose epimerase [Campylobacter sp. MIT 19-121]TKX30168.1 dTDP-4-dehydrorhamnose 3,5-epimerase [Campylobacter sp. MIT 12-5580]TQR42416.1 dTDP-4-dehydrorhamnose 3,5-epimerase [Campylobacter sp. MIT 12-8780]